MVEEIRTEELQPIQKTNNSKTKKKTSKSQIKATALIDNGNKEVEIPQLNKNKSKYGKIISFKGNKARIICEGICYLIDKTDDMKVGNSYKIK